MRANTLSFLAALPVMLLATGCLRSQAAQDGSDCDDAFNKICDDGTIDCDARPPPAIEVLRRCEGDEIRADARYGNLSLCIKDSATYVPIVAALASRHESLCSMTCSPDTACDQEDACHEFQYMSCDRAVIDGEAPDAS